MTIFYICRHGETVNNMMHVLSGWADTPLTEEGVLHAESYAQKLAGIQFDKIVSSDLGRAVTTADIIKRSIGWSGDIERRNALREVNYGEFAGQPYSVYPHVTPHENTDFTPPGGESLAQMQQRVMDCVHELALSNPDKTILIVAHDGTINAVNADYTGKEIGIVDAESRNGHDFVAKFEYEDRKVTSFIEV